MSGEGLEITQLVGSAWNGETSGEAPESWSAQRVVTPISIEESIQTGSLLIVINVKDGEVSAIKGTDLVEELVTRFQTEGGFPRSEWIKRTKDFLLEKDSGAVNIALVVIWKNPKGKRVAFITGIGKEMEVRIERDGLESKIWPNSGQWISGWLKESDRLVIGTGKFWREMWVNVENLDERIESCRGKMAADESGEAAAVIIEVEPEEGDVLVADKPVWPRAERETVGLKPVENVRRKWLFRIGGVFLVLLLVSVGVGMWRRDKIEKQNRYDAVSQPIKDELTEAEQIRSINPTRARDLMTKAKQTIESTKGFETGEFATAWRDLSQKIDQEWQTVSGEKQIESKDWFDLSVIKEGMTANRMMVDGNWLELLDTNNKLLGAVNLKDKSSQQLLAGSSLQGVVGLAKGVVLADKGLIKLHPDKKTTANIFQQMDELTGVFRLATFGGNVYTVDATDLWKFPATDSGLGGRRRYFGVGVTPSLSDVIDIWVDGDVWLLTNSGMVSRYTKGAKDLFTLNGWNSIWGKVERIETTSKEVLIWDKQNGVVVVFDRDNGDYKRKLINDNLKTATDIVIDEIGQRVLMVVEGKLMEMPIN